jgi:hypothetical protein
MPAQQRPVRITKGCISALFCQWKKQGCRLILIIIITFVGPLSVLLKDALTQIIMKQLIPVTRLFLILLFLGMSSCEKEIPLSEAIIGKWEVQSIRAVTSQAGVKKSETTIYLESEELAVQFADDGAGIWYENGETSGLFDWELSGSTLTIMFGINSIDWHVEIDGNTLIWSYTETEVIDQVTYDLEYFYTAKKTS